MTLPGDFCAGASERRFLRPCDYHTTPTGSEPFLLILARGISVLLLFVELLSLMGLCTRSSRCVSRVSSNLSAK